MNEVKPAAYCERCYTLITLPIEECTNGNEIDCPYCNNSITIQDADLHL